MEFRRHKVVRFLISPKKKKMKIEVNKIIELGLSLNVLSFNPDL